MMISSHDDGGGRYAILESMIDVPHFPHYRLAQA
jgi:hypothetical protein